MSAYGDGFFDTPSGYSDADLEMAALEDAGNRWRCRYTRRGLEQADVDTLRGGGSVTVACKSRETGVRYSVTMRALDCDEIGPCDFSYSTNEIDWYGTAREAHAGGVDTLTSR